MEGSRCCFPECRVHDFLPFHCPRCELTYCLDHRSRFVHHCVETEQPRHVSTSHLPNVKDMMKSVETRFDNNSSVGGAPRDHHQIKSSAPVTATKSEDRAQKQITRLESLQNNASNSRTRRISDQTRRILIKNHAKGNPNLPEEDRVYLVIRFHQENKAPQAPKNEFYVYFSKRTTLAEALHHIKQNYASAIHSNYKALPHDLSNTALVAYTDDEPDWKQWDRSAMLGDVVSSFEELTMLPMTLDEAIAQQEAMQVTKYQDTTMEVDSTLPPPVPVGYSKGDKAWYHKSKEKIHNGRDADIHSVPAILVNIIGVHHDDFPNIYYTISMVQPAQIRSATLQQSNIIDSLAFHTEKQTDANHLFPIEHDTAAPEPIPSPAKPAQSSAAPQSNAASIVQLQQELSSLGGDILDLSATHSGKEQRNIQVSSRCSIGQLKNLLSLIFQIPTKSMKLICKGVVLKSDTQLIKDTKIQSGAKLTILGS